MRAKQVMFLTALAFLAIAAVAPLTAEARNMAAIAGPSGQAAAGGGW